MKNTVDSLAVRHPGEFIGEIIKGMGMSQKELAIRSGYSEKHVSTVIAGSKDVSLAFARRVERALGLDTDVLMNKQVEYDKDKLEREERNNIQPGEYDVIKRLGKVKTYLVENNLMPKLADEVDEIVEFRDFLRVSDLSIIPKLTYNAAYRAQIKGNKRVDPYILFAWQQMCERLTKKIETSDNVDFDKLQASLQMIRRLMFQKPSIFNKKLREFFADCGIAFLVVQHFVGAPVQGFIKETQDGRIILCLTLRQMRQDIFWFTLFHEIGHILNGDVKQKFVDFDVKSETEERADAFARETLLPSADYQEFVKQDDFSSDSIAAYAKSQGVPGHIVYGRLLRDEFLEYSATVMRYLPKYVWKD